METNFVSRNKSVLLVIFAVFSFSFIQTKKGVETLSIEEALQRKLITASFISTGSYQGSSIDAKLKSNSSALLKVKIPAGTYFKAQTGEEQDLVTVQDVMVQVAPQKTLTKNIDGFCCIASNRCPIKDNKFSIVPNKIQKFDQLTSFMKGKNYEKGTIQDAVWVMSDQKSISNISSEDKVASKALREHLSSITGQKNEWYEAPQNRVVDPYGNINPQTVAIKGMIEFDNKTNASVHQEVQDKDGNVLMKTDRKFPLQKGEVKYYFSLSVTGWQKGKYSVKLMNGSNVLVVNEFEV